MNILFISSEVEPFAKTGGLADVCGALPRSIAQLGARISVITPFYRETSLRMRNPISVADLQVSAGPHTVHMQIITERERHDVPVYFVRCDELFDRDGIY